MVKETVLIVGLGEIGHTLFALYREANEKFLVYGLDLDMEKMIAAQSEQSQGSSRKLTSSRFAFHVAVKKNSLTQSKATLTSTSPNSQSLTALFRQEPHSKLQQSARVLLLIRLHEAFT